MPTDTPPSKPQKPWTEMAPQGWSILVTRSLKSTPPQTSRPASKPMTTDAVGPTKAHGAVMATRPASIPLQAMVTSGLPNIMYQKSMAAAEPAMAARLVLTATTEMRRSVATRVEPGLKPIHPNRRLKVPATTQNPEREVSSGVLGGERID